MRKLSLQTIKKDFSFLKPKIMSGEILAVLLYGSYINGKQNIKSDIDICIVAPGLKTPKQFSEILGFIWRKINANKYDVRIFEELPLYIKASIINNYSIIYANNLKNLYEYFYFFRKLWLDQSVNWIEKKV